MMALAREYNKSNHSPTSPVPDIAYSSGNKSSIVTSTATATAICICLATTTDILIASIKASSPRSLQNSLYIRKLLNHILSYTIDSWLNVFLIMATVPKNWLSIIHILEDFP